MLVTSSPGVYSENAGRIAFCRHPSESCTDSPQLSISKSRCAIASLIDLPPFVHGSRNRPASYGLLYFVAHRASGPVK